MHAQLFARLNTTVSLCLKKLRSKAKLFEEQMKDAGRASGVQMEADLITANLYRWGGREVREVGGRGP